MSFINTSEKVKLLELPVEVDSLKALHLLHHKSHNHLPILLELHHPMEGAVLHCIHGLMPELKLVPFLCNQTVHFSPILCCPGELLSTPKPKAPTFLDNIASDGLRDLPVLPMALNLDVMVGIHNGYPAGVVVLHGLKHVVHLILLVQFVLAHNVQQ